MPLRETAYLGAIKALFDREAISRVILEWGLYRDGSRWDSLLELYAPDALMYTTWFCGRAEEFVRLSTIAAAKGARVQHFVGTPLISLNGDRAIAETRMTILVRAMVADTEVDVTCFGSFHDWLVRLDTEWRILKRIPVYEKDRIDAVDPKREIGLDPIALARFAEGYRHLAYVQSLVGENLPQGLPTRGSVEEKALYAESLAWLGGGGGSRTFDAGKLAVEVGP
jgi:hypothetical protein